MPYPTSRRRQVFVDTETTGLSAARGDRIVELAAVEAIDGRLTGREFHSYVNPERLVSPAAQRIHGLSDKFLSSKRKFHEIADEFAAFVKDAECFMHNASFDTKFIDAELRLARKAHSLSDLALTRCTVQLARARLSLSSVSLDALLSHARIGVQRSQHSALEDARLLAQVFFAVLEVQPTNPTDCSSTKAMADNTKLRSSPNQSMQATEINTHQILGIKSHLAWRFDAVLPGSFRRDKKDFAHLTYPVLGPLPTARGNTKPIEQASAPGPFIYCVVDAQGSVRYIGKTKEKSVIKRWSRPGIGGPADYYWTHSTKSGGCVFNIASGIGRNEGPYELRYIPLGDLKCVLSSQFNSDRPTDEILEIVEGILINSLRPAWNVK